MKKITVENYFQPCEQIQAYGRLNLISGEVERVTEVDIINLTNDINLNENVPDEVKSLFDASKALYAYGYLYWTFFTLAHEQAYKSFEAAVSYKYNEIFLSLYDIKGKPFSLAKKIRDLTKKGIMNNKNQLFYDAIRELRNMSFHPSRQSLYGHNIDAIKNIANEINLIFK